jgi:hypothetical protein
MEHEFFVIASHDLTIATVIAFKLLLFMILLRREKRSKFKAGSAIKRRRVYELGDLVCPRKRLQRMPHIRGQGTKSSGGNAALEIIHKAIRAVL